MHSTPLGRLVPLAALVAVLALAACQPGGSSTTASPTALGSASALASASEDATASTAETGMCLDQDVIAAIDELDSGNLQTDPSPAQVADALEGLQLTGDAADARDAVVTRLREDPMNETAVVTSILALKAQVALPAC